MFELVEILLCGDVDLCCQLVLQNGPGRLKGDVARLHANAALSTNHT